MGYFFVLAFNCGIDHDGLLVLLGIQSVQKFHLVGGILFIVLWFGVSYVLLVFGLFSLV